MAYFFKLFIKAKTRQKTLIVLNFFRRIQRFTFVCTVGRDKKRCGRFTRFVSDCCKSDCCVLWTGTSGVHCYVTGCVHTFVYMFCGRFGVVFAEMCACDFSTEYCCCTRGYQCATVANRGNFVFGSYDDFGTNQTFVAG